MQSIVVRPSKCSKFQCPPSPPLNSVWRTSESCQSIVNNTLSNVVTVRAIEGVASVLSFFLSKAFYCCSLGQGRSDQEIFSLSK
jgi:hypothetical protein